MTISRWDETWHRLLQWTNGQAQSERLAHQILLHQGFENLDPSHPLGGRDGGRDAVAQKDGKRWVVGIYFPRGQRSFAEIERKFRDDLRDARRSEPFGFAFVTNQELRLAERDNLTEIALPQTAGLYHLERLTTILDSPSMVAVRKQFLGIDSGTEGTIALGGAGGNASGAGGGGGAAIGDGARAGDGGPGGNITLHGAPGSAPGGGGGGGGSIGHNAKGGTGGGGGEYIEGLIDLAELRALHGVTDLFVHATVGQGKKGGAPGLDGEEGGDTVIEIVTADGRVLESRIARGGKAGRCGSSGAIET